MLGNPLTGRVMGELQNLRGNYSDEFRDRCSEGKLRTLTREIVVEQHFPAEKQLTSGSGFRTQTSRKRTGVGFHEDTGESRENHGPTREAKDHSQVYSLIPHAHRHRTPP